MIAVCVHWSATKKPNAGKCALGLHGGEPSLGVCSVCEFRNDQGPDLLTRIRNFAAASKQEVKAITAGAPPPSAEEIEKRRNICQSCERLNDSGECSLCGCKVRAKTSWRSTSCPAGKW
jgi:hypothetical protein